MARLNYFVPASKVTPASKTLQALDKATLDLAERQEQRKHLGASIIGGDCAREIFYKFRWAFPGQPHAARLLRLFGRGHREEVEIIKLLRKAGVTVYAAGESGELKESLRISDVDGHFGGTPDGVGVGIPDLPADLPVLLEFKTYNDQRFHQLQRDGVRATSREYFIQMQVYMEKLELTKALFLAVNKDDDQLYAEIVDSHKPDADKFLQRARDIIYADKPPPKIADSIARFPCKWCDFKNICHTADFPAINCRTCCHSSVGPGGTWTCARGKTAEVVDQRGCPEHLYDPRWWEDWSILDANFEQNWLLIDTGVEKIKHGTAKGCTTSAELLRDGLVPF